MNKAGLAYAIHTFEADPEATSYGRETAASLHVEPQRVFKTLVANVDGQPTAAIVPVLADLDLRALAAAVGGDNAELCDEKDVAQLTGYPAADISPLAQKKRLPTVADTAILGFKTVYVSAGQHGVDIELNPEDLVSLTRARTAPVSRQRR